MDETTQPTFEVISDTEIQKTEVVKTIINTEEIQARIDENNKAIETYEGSIAVRRAENE